MGNDVEGGQFVIQKSFKFESKRDLRSVALKPEEIRQFKANSMENDELAKARRIKERSQVIVKEMEAKIKEQEDEAEKKAKEENNKERTIQKFDPSNISFEAFLGN